MCDGGDGFELVSVVRNLALSWPYVGQLCRCWPLCSRKVRDLGEKNAASGEGVVQCLMHSTKAQAVQLKPHIKTLSAQLAKASVELEINLVETNAVNTTLPPVRRVATRVLNEN